MLETGGAEQITTDLAGRSSKVLNKLLEVYRGHFDISLNHELLGVTLPAMASFHSRGEKFLLVKSAKIWAMECNEHALFYTPPVLDEHELRKITELLESAEVELVKPHSEHMYTYLSAVIITENAQDAALSMVRRYKWRKNYRFSFYGWCCIRLAVLDLSTGTIATNHDGKDMRDALSTVLGGVKRPAKTKF